jgi:uncharacterized protein YyaL (SSP411 family)
MMRSTASMIFFLLVPTFAHASPPSDTQSVEARLTAAYQKGHGGFDPNQKNLDPEIIELGLIESANGNVVVRGMVQKTLLNAVALIDPADGGAFDRSLATDVRHPWRTPTGKKSLRTQAINLRLYSMAHEIFGGDRYLAAASDVYGYLERSLAAPGGGFHEPGEERVPTAENGMVIAALVAYHRASGERRAIDAALATTDRMVAERALASGGFRDDAGGALSLEATVAMVEAMKALPRARFSGEIERSLAAIAGFAHAEGGFAGEDGSRSLRLNVSIARMGGSLRDHAMHLLTSDAAASSAKEWAAVVLADHQFRIESITVAVRN